MPGRWSLAGAALLPGLLGTVGCAPSATAVALDAAGREWACPASQVAIVSEVVPPETTDNHREFVVSACDTTGTVACDYESWMSVDLVVSSQWFCRERHRPSPIAPR
jgi:hypothetical protein